MACCNTSENSKFEVIRLASDIVEFNYWTQKDAVCQVHNQEKYRAEILNQSIPELQVPSYPTIEEILAATARMYSFADSDLKLEALKFAFKTLSDTYSEFKSVSDENWNELVERTPDTEPLPIYPDLPQVTVEKVIEESKKIVDFL